MRSGCWDFFKLAALGYLTPLDAATGTRFGYLACFLGALVMTDECYFHIHEKKGILTTMSEHRIAPRLHPGRMLPFTEMWVPAPFRGIVA